MILSVASHFKSLLSPLSDKFIINTFRHRLREWFVSLHLLSLISAQASTVTEVRGCTNPHGPKMHEPRQPEDARTQTARRCTNPDGPKMHEPRRPAGLLRASSHKPYNTEGPSEKQSLVDWPFNDSFSTAQATYSLMGECFKWHVSLCFQSGPKTDKSVILLNCVFLHYAFKTRLELYNAVWRIQTTVSILTT
jgi:hypothetical protein